MLELIISFCGGGDDDRGSCLKKATMTVAWQQPLPLSSLSSSSFSFSFVSSAFSLSSSSSSFPSPQSFYNPAAEIMPFANSPLGVSVHE